MVRVQKKFGLPSRTKQAFKDECDVNKIMKRFKRQNNVDFLEKFHGYVGGEFGDFSDVADYRAALDQVSHANGVFMALPSIVRKRFGNDPAEFLDFCQNPDNAQELISLGLANPKVPILLEPVDEVKTDKS